MSQASRKGPSPPMARRSARSVSTASPARAPVAALWPDMPSAPVLLLAPDSFKGTFSAAAVAEALAVGVVAEGGWPDRCPVADGGEGTLSVLVAAGGGVMSA